MAETAQLMRFAAKFEGLTVDYRYGMSYSFLAIDWRHM
jgi:hypothetical protein